MDRDITFIKAIRDHVRTARRERMEAFLRAANWDAVMKLKGSVSELEQLDEKMTTLLDEPPPDGEATNEHRQDSPARRPTSKTTRPR